MATQPTKKSVASTTEAAAKVKATPDDGLARLQASFDRDAEQGFHGHSPDKTPRENYTLAGVTSGKPTPETERGK